MESSETTLKDRVSSASCGSRELDAEIAAHFRWHPTNVHLPRLSDGYHWSIHTHVLLPGMVSWVSNAPDGDFSVWGTFDTPKWSTSVDAALALVGEKLPGWTGRLTFTSEEVWADLSRDGDDLHMAKAPTAPLAILLALLSALEQAGETA